jgi:hypothetical protein
MTAGLEVDVESGIAQVSFQMVQCLYLGVWPAKATMMALGDYPAIADDNGSNHWIGADPTFSPARQLQGPFHEMLIHLTPRLTELALVNGSYNIA